MRNRSKFKKRFQSSRKMTNCANCSSYDNCERRKRGNNIMLGTYKIKYDSITLNVCDYHEDKGIDRLNEFKLKYKLQDKLKVTCDNCKHLDKTSCRVMKTGNLKERYKIEWDIDVETAKDETVVAGVVCNSWQLEEENE